MFIHNQVFSSPEEPGYEVLLTWKNMHVSVGEHCVVYCKCLFPKYCRYGRLDVVRYLVTEADCNPNVRDNGGETPLHWACR